MSRTVAADSDARMVIASKLAYINLYPSSTLSVGDQLNVLVDMYHVRGEKDPPELNQYQLNQYQNAKSALELIEKLGVKDCENWMIRDTLDDNDSSGFYGCMFDTGDGDAILGFRGSEGGIQKSMTDPTAFRDWIEADLGLMNNPETTQQSRAREFTDYIYQKYGDQYTYDFAGHSLGGNLASHATVSSPEGMRIHRCASYDGPGFSKEYLDAHEDAIQSRAGVIDHYQGTIVGSLLTALPGSNYVSMVTTRTDGYFSQHELENIAASLDGNGQVQQTTMDGLAVAFKQMSLVFDQNELLYYCNVCPLIFSLLTVTSIVSESIDGYSYVINGIKQWYNNSTIPALTGEYTLNSTAVNDLSQDALKAARKLITIRDQIDGIANSLHFNSLAGAVYR